MQCSEIDIQFAHTFYWQSLKIWYVPLCNYMSISVLEKLQNCSLANNNNLHLIIHHYLREILPQLWSPSKVY